MPPVMIATDLTQAPHGGRDTKHPERGVEQSTPPLVAELPLMRSFSRWSRRARQVGCMALALGCWSGDAGASAVGISHLRVTPDGFGYGTITVACELKNSRDKFLPADSGSGTISSRCMFQVLADATGQSWGSGWFLIPPLAPHETITGTSEVVMIPDSISARRITRITVMVWIDEGNGRLKVHKRRYHRWRDQLFHPRAEENAAPPRPQQAAGAPSIAPRTATAFVVSGGTAGTEPQHRRLSLGAFEVRYRAVPADSVTSTVRVRPIRRELPVPSGAISPLIPSIQTPSGSTRSPDTSP